MLEKSPPIKEAFMKKSYKLTCTLFELLKDITDSNALFESVLSTVVTRNT